MSDEQAADSPIQVVSKVVQVMDCFALSTPVLTVSEIRRTTGLPATTCARILRSLVAADLLERNGEEYRTGLRVLAWSASASAGSRLVAAAGPVIDSLRDQTLETAGVFVRNGANRRMALAVAESTQRIIYRVDIHQVMPMHTGAIGKVFMAFDPAAWQLAETAGFKAFTDSTVTEPSALQHQLERVRVEGYAVARDEREQGLSSIAAPVFQADGRLIAAVGLGLPSFRFGPDDQPRLVAAVVAAGEVLSEALGYSPTSDGRVSA